MAAITKSYSAIPYLSNARSTIALEQVRDRAVEKGDDVVAAEAQTALHDNGRWRVGIDGWIAQNRSAARKGGETYAVDVEADFVIGRIYGILEGLSRRRAGTAAGKAAAKLVLDHFTDARGKSGMGVMAQVVYEEQLPRMRRFIAALDAEEGLARLVRIADWVDDLRGLEPRYARALSTTAGVTWGEVIALRNVAYDSLFAVVGLIAARHRREPATFAWLMAPIDDQINRAAEQNRRRRAGEAMVVNEDELSAEELLELEGVAEDADGDGVPDAGAPQAEGEPTGGGAGDAADEAGEAPAGEG